MIRILFDEQRYFLSKNVNDYFDVLINELSKNSEFQIIQTKSKNETLKHLTVGDFDIYHSTGFVDNYFLNDLMKDKKMVVTVFDMINEILLDKSVNQEPLKYQIRNKAEQIFVANNVIVPSETTYKYLIALYKRYNIEDKIRIISGGISDNKEKLERINNLGKFILYVDDRFPLIDYKQFEKFLQEVVPFLMEHEDLNLILTSIKFSKDEVDNILKKYNIYDRVLVGEYNEQLFEQALCCVYSSIIEGFDISVLLCIKHNCICLLNDKNPFYHEIGKDKIAYYNIDKLDVALNEVLNISKEDKKLIIDNQKTILDKFSLLKFINMHIQIYKQLMNENS